ncbi:MAG: O-antigen ligase family protein [Ignavibacteriales bacterium]|nr:MAG: O-antigen ligase family protein [Ignavibacteriales bacterium]
MFLKELYKIRFLILVEIALLISIIFIGYYPALIIVSGFFLIVFFIYSYCNIITLVQTLLFAILIDSLVVIGTTTSGPSVLVVEFFLFIVIVITIFRYLSKINHATRFYNLVLLWIPFLVWSLIIGLIIAVDKFRVISYWKNYFAGFFIFSLTYYSIKESKNVRTLILTIITWGFLLSILEFKVLFELGGFAKGIVGLFLKKNLLSVGWGKSNYIAAFFVVIIPISIGYLYYSNSRKLKYFIILSLISMSFAFILTLSRGGIIALVFALVILFSRVLSTRTLIPFLSMIILITTLLLLNPLTYVLFDSIATLDTSSSLYSRINYYEDVWHAFLKYPITGVGFGNLSYYATFILPPDTSPAAHNIILGALGEVGIVGFIMYSAIIGFLMRELYSHYKIEQDNKLKIFKWCFLSAIIGALVHTLVEPTLDGLQFSIMFWSISAIYLKLDVINKQSVEE